MKAINRKALSIICALFITSLWSATPKPSDSLSKWLQKFYTVGNIELSENGKWATFKKWRAQNNDTITVLDVHAKNSTLGFLIKQPFIEFTPNNHLLSTGNNKAVWWDLMNNHKLEIEKVSKAFTLGSGDRFCTISREEKAVIYDKKGSVVKSFDGVKVWVKQKEGIGYIIHKVEETWNIEQLTSTQSKTIFSSKYEIKNIEVLGKTNKFLAITILDKMANKIILQILNIPSGKIVYSKENDFKKFSSVKVKALDDLSTVIIDFQGTIPPENSPWLDIWYGNDKEMESKQYGKQIHDYSVWNANTGAEVQIDNQKFSEVIPFNNSNEVMVFNALEENDYILHRPLLNIYLYNVSDRSYKLIFRRVSNVVTDGLGKYIIAFDFDKRNWLLYDCQKRILKGIKASDLQNPVFSADGTSILLESSFGLMNYEIKNENLRNVMKEKEYKTTVVNPEVVDLNNHFDIVIRKNNLKTPLLLKLSNEKNNTTSYKLYRDKDEDIDIIPFTKERIKELKFDKKLENFLFIKENYNIPPQVETYNTITKKNKIGYKVKLSDKSTSLLKQEVLTYKNTLGKELKAVLYYPVNYDSTKKYPMIVHIYQIQSHTSNRYQMPKIDDPLGFNIRLLQQKGYFVLLPDIIHDNRGTGWSALDGVHSALDFLEQCKGIDKKRIGLTGHSHGGYETNFIATHSNRFAAYISGAGHSDIVRAYFSYSYKFNIPFYWQFENQQYEMFKPFAEDKMLYLNNNPIMDVEKVNAPILLWTGQKDETVHWGHTIEFYIGLKRNKKKVIALLYKEKEHDVGIGTLESFDLNKRSMEWWDYFLKDKKDIDWINQEMNKDAF